MRRLEHQRLSALPPHMSPYPFASRWFSVRMSKVVLILLMIMCHSDMSHVQHRAACQPETRRRKQADVLLCSCKVIDDSLCCGTLIKTPVIYHHGSQCNYTLYIHSTKCSRCMIPICEFVSYLHPRMMVDITERFSSENIFPRKMYFSYRSRKCVA